MAYAAKERAKNSGAAVWFWIEKPSARPAVKITRSFFSFIKRKKNTHWVFFSKAVGSADLIELQRQRALLVRCVVLVDQTLAGGHIDLLDGDLVCAFRLGAIAFCGSSLELLNGGLHSGLLNPVLSIAGLSEQNTLLSRLNIRQTKHLLRQEICMEHISILRAG